MSYNDPWAWADDKPTAPLAAAIQPAQAEPAQVRQEQPGIINGVIKPMVINKAANAGVDYATKAIMAPLATTAATGAATTAATTGATAMAAPAAASMMAPLAAAAPWVAGAYGLGKMLKIF